MDATGTRALFESPVQAPPETRGSGASRDGRDALYSGHRREPGTVVVECESCTARTRVSLADLGLRFLSGSLWLPLLKGSHPHFVRCPACRRRSWCRVGWTE